MLRIEEAMGPEKGAVLGLVDIWRSDRTVVRRLYNAQQELLATSIGSKDGTTSEQIEEGAPIGEKERQIIESGVWRSDVSSRAIDTGGGAAADAFRGASGFEVTEHEDGRNGVLSRTLVLDRSYQVQSERVRYRNSGGVHEVRLVQTLLRRVPNKDVPPLTFPHSQEMTAPGPQGENTLRRESDPHATEDVDSADLEVAVLFELFQRKADIGEPVEVIPISGGRIRIAGTVASAQLVETLRQDVAVLPNASRVDFQIRSVREAASGIRRENAHSQELLGTSGDAPAAGLVRNAMIARGLKGEALKNAEQAFAASALSHAQAALQHAYALDRLGIVLKQAGQPSLNFDSRVKWAQMVDQHSAAAIAELNALRMQLDSISAGINGIPVVDARGIANSAAFARATSDLRAKAQSVNEQVVELFAGSAASVPQPEAQDSILRLRETLPFLEARRVSLFADWLATRIPAAQNDVGEMQKR
jgi:hypothetical protein